MLFIYFLFKKVLKTTIGLLRLLNLINLFDKNQHVCGWTIKDFRAVFNNAC